MRKGWIATVGLLAVLGMAATAGASLFVEWSLDQVVQHSSIVVRGTVVRNWTSWDATNEVIFTFSEINVNRSLLGNADRTVVVRTIGGTVGNYTQEAAGFPVLREGEDVVLFLDVTDQAKVYGMPAYNQGKFLVQRDAEGQDVLVRDTRTQGHDPAEAADHVLGAARSGLTMGELASMLDAVRRGLDNPVQN